MIGVVSKALEEGRKKIRAYHGSPHDFDRFSTDNIGTGEGLQVYGRGLYFAEREGTAQSYRDALRYRDSDPKIALKEAEIDETFSDESLRSFTAALSDAEDKSPSQIADNIQMMSREFRSIPKEKIIDAVSRYQDKVRGRMYEVDIDASPDELLDYDLPLNEQSDYVKSRLPKELFDREGARGINAVTDYPIPNSEMMSNADYSQKAADALRESGIKGVKYADAQTRFSPKGKTHNYVIFDDKLVEIARKYGVTMPVAGAILAGTITPEQAQAGVVTKALEEGKNRLQRAFDQGFDMSPEGRLYHASKQDIHEMQAGYDDGLVFTTPDPEFANQWLGKGKFQERQGHQAQADVKNLTKSQRDLRNEIFYGKNNTDEEWLNLKGEEYNAEYDRRQKIYHDAIGKDIYPTDMHSTIYPLVTRTKKPFRPDQDYGVLEELYGKDYLDAPFGSGFATFRDAMKDGNYLLYENKEVVDFLKRKGYDSMFLKESSGKDSPFTTLAVFDGKNLRSPHAQFKDASSGNLLAGSAATAITLPALLGSNKTEASVARPQKDGILKDTGDVLNEAVSSVNRGVVDGLNFFTADQVNAVLNLMGSDKRIPNLYDVPYIKEATQGNYMDEGLPRDVVRTGFEMFSPF